jgi:hypothetical protein
MHHHEQALDMSRKSIILILTGFLVLSSIALIVPYFTFDCYMAGSSNACVSNLRTIQGAKEQWGLENHKTTNDSPTWDDIRPYMGRGAAGEIPICPHGGIYTPARFGQPPTCSIGGPTLSLDYDYWRENLYFMVVRTLFLLSFGLLVVLCLLKKTSGQVSETTT